MSIAEGTRVRHANGAEGEGVVQAILYRMKDPRGRFPEPTYAEVQWESVDFRSGKPRRSYALCKLDSLLDLAAHPWPKPDEPARYAEFRRILTHLGYQVETREERLSHAPFKRTTPYVVVRGQEALLDLLRRPELLHLPLQWKDVHSSQRDADDYTYRVYPREPEEDGA